MILCKASSTTGCCARPSRKKIPTLHPLGAPNLPLHPNNRKRIRSKYAHRLIFVSVAKLERGHSCPQQRERAARPSSPHAGPVSPSPLRSGGEGRGEEALRAHGETSFDVQFFRIYRLKLTKCHPPTTHL